MRRSSIQVESLRPGERSQPGWLDPTASASSLNQDDQTSAQTTHLPSSPSFKHTHKLLVITLENNTIHRSGYCDDNSWIILITSTHRTDSPAGGSCIMLFRLLTLLKAYFSSTNDTLNLEVSGFSTI